MMALGAWVLIPPADADDVALTTRGRWRPAAWYGIRGANVSCPGCGRTLSLRDYLIEGTGRVRPQMVCRTTPGPGNLGCDWSAFVRLDGWDGT